MATIKKRIKEKHGEIVTLDVSSWRGVNYPATFIDCDFGTWVTKGTNVLEGRGHPERANAQRRTAKSEIVRTCARNNIQYLDSFYKKYQLVVKCRCTLCNFEWESFYSNIKFQNCACFRCSHLKREKTCLARYGVTHPIKNDMIKKRIRKTVMNKYGVTNPMKCHKVAIKNAKAQTKSTTLLHWETRETLQCIGSYEKATVEFLNRLRIPFKWQHKTFSMSDGRTYRPDLYLEKADLWIEIKGYFRKDAKEKWDWFHTYYSNSELWNETTLKSKGILQ